MAKKKFGQIRRQRKERRRKVGQKMFMKEGQKGVRRKVRARKERREREER